MFRIQIGIAGVEHTCSSYMPLLLYMCALCMYTKEGSEK